MSRKFKKFNTIGDEEIKEILAVLQSGNLSGFYGSWSEEFYGGPYVKRLEQMAEREFETKNAVTFNSWTSALVAAVGSLDVEPGDEIIVSPWTMSATAMAILHWNCVPVFSDINKDTYCLDEDMLIEKINPYTKAIIAVDIFGQSSRTEKLMEIAEEHEIKVISDSAQAAGAKRNNKCAGTLSHFGGISLNYHKHIHTGEGGILFTDDDELAFRSRLIRNHAESVVGGAGVEKINNMIGHNFRMTELQAAVGVAQLPKLKGIVAKREYQGQYLSERLGSLAGLRTPIVDTNNSHVFYTLAFQIDQSIVKSSRDEIVKDLTRQGVPGLTSTYPLLHLLPMFQRKVAYGSRGFPWNLRKETNSMSYSKGICPIAESLIENTFFHLYLNEFDFDQDDMDYIVDIFESRWQHYL